jgi:hypothetical protein
MGAEHLSNLGQSHIFNAFIMAPSPTQVDIGNADPSVPELFGNLLSGLDIQRALLTGQCVPRRTALHR